MRAARGVDHELQAGSSAHYDDPAYYAKAYADRVDDVAYYVALARACGGPVLEYGCGAGRIALPIARAGVSVTGVDLSAPMLDDLRARLSREPKEVQRRVATRRGDMRSIALRRRFPLVIAAFNTILHLYVREDLERFFARVRAHLTPRGRFVFDTSVPVVADLARDPSESFAIPAFRHPTLGVRCRYRERFDYDPIRQVLFVAMEFTPMARRSAGVDVELPEPFMTPLAHRQLFPAELEALLHYNGFVVERREGGFLGEPLDRHTDSIVWTCRARRERGE